MRNKLTFQPKGTYLWIP